MRIVCASDVFQLLLAIQHWWIQNPLHGSSRDRDCKSGTSAAEAALAFFCLSRG
jgi:hypothetical protein